jgi:hypothetical protein
MYYYPIGFLEIDNTLEDVEASLKEHQAAMEKARVRSLWIGLQ